MSRRFRPLFWKVVAYILTIVVVSVVIHLYVVYPYYFKKIPYFSKAAWQSVHIRCDESAPEGIESILRNVTLPFFALEAQIVLVDTEKNISLCHVPDDSSSVQRPTYRLASLTKAMTSFVILDLSDRHLISLDDHLLDFFPEIDPEKINDHHIFEVTLRDLLNHSSGFGGPFGSDNMVKKGERPWCPYDLSMIESVRLAGKPGTDYVYSNVAYCLLGEVIREVTGTDYRSYIAKNYLARFPSLTFASSAYLASEPEYDYSNDYRFGEGYLDWLDFEAISPAAGLMGEPKEFAEMVSELVGRHPSVLYDEGVAICWESGAERCYSNTFVVYKGDNGSRIGVQQGYFPGVSSLVAITSEGEVLVWAAAGAPMEASFRELLEKRVVSFLDLRSRL